MSLLSIATDTFYAFRFLRLLTTPWKDTKAYKLGILDENGKVVRKATSTEERSVYTVFHRLVFNLKRLMNKVPGGKSTAASYIAALWLIKEHAKISDASLRKTLSESFDITVIAEDINETSAHWYKTSDGAIKEGNYTLYNDIALPATGDPYCTAGSTIIVKEDCYPVGSVLGVDIYKVFHHKLKKGIYVTLSDIRK
jgi:hypothetical protein